MKGLRSILRYIWFCIACGLLPAACSDSEVPTPEPGDGQVAGQETVLSFMVRVPDLAKPFTRTGTGLPFDPDRENRVSTATILFMSRDASGRDDKLFRILPAKSVERDEENPLVYTFKVSFFPNDPDTEAYNAVILANTTADELAAVLKEGMTAAQVQEAALTFKPAKDDTTPLLPRNDSVPLPMWGRVEGVRVGFVDGVAMRKYSTSLLRSVARVDVTVDAELPPELFELVSVSVVNGSEKLAYFPLNPQPIEGQSGHWQVTEPHDPGTLHNIQWDHDSVAIDNNISHTLYIPEAHAGLGAKTYEYGDANHYRRTAIVIGAKYKGEEAVDTASIQYYRVDFRDPETGDLLHVLRNHLYTFRVKEVHGGGAESPQAAYMDPLPNLEAELIDWDIPYKEIVWYGKDWISTSVYRIDLTGNTGASTIFKVKSTLPLTTLRLRWLEDDHPGYHIKGSDSDDCAECMNGDLGMFAGILVTGDEAQVGVKVIRPNPPDSAVRVRRLAVRVSSLLKIVIPVTVQPLPPDRWDGNHEIEI